MGFHTSTSIDVTDLKERIDLLDVIGADTELHKVAKTRGGEYAGPCPFCGGRDRLRVQPDAGLWWCRSCSGDHWQDAIAYVQQRDGCSFTQACQTLGAHPYNAPVRISPSLRVRPNAGPAEDPEPPAAWQAAAQAFVVECESVLWSPQGHDARQHLERRGLTPETMRAWHVGFNPTDASDAPEAWGLTTVDTGGKRLWKPRGIVLPWLLDGTVSQLKIRRPDSDRMYAAIKGGHPLIFGADTLADHSVAVLTEGEFDAMLVHQEAGDLVGVVTLGSASKGLSTRAVDHLLPVATLLAAYDMDGDGERGATRLAALSARVRRARIPSGKDITEFWQRGGSVRAWVEYELERVRMNTTAAGLSAPGAAPLPTPSRDTAHEDFEVRYPFDVRWAQERGWLKVRDPFDGKWHEVRARDCPLHWISRARAEKEQRQWAA